MVFLAEKRSLRTASCCSLLVMNGGTGNLRFSLVATDCTTSFAALNGRGDLVGRRLVGNFEVLALEFHHPGFEGRRLLAFHAGGDRPVFLFLERLDFPLAFDDHAQRHGLHAPGGNSAPDLLPQQRANLIAHQPVQNAARLLRVHQMRIDFAGALKSFPDRVARNLIKEYPVEFLLGRIQKLVQVLANGLALAVRVSRQVNGVSFARRRLQLGNHRLLGGDRNVGGLEIVLHVHSQVLLGKIHDVAHASLHGKVRTQIFVNGLRLGRRFDNNQRFTHDALCRQLTADS